jgi:hypothetical protein
MMERKEGEGFSRVAKPGYWVGGWTGVGSVAGGPSLVIPQDSMTFYVATCNGIISSQLLLFS